jgi:plastocyanin
MDGVLLVHQTAFTWKRGNLRLKSPSRTCVLGNAGDSLRQLQERQTEKKARESMAEPNIAKVTIANAPAQTTVFQPNPQTITQFDSVFWSNETAEAHQPAPDGGADDQWVSRPIPPKGQSSQVVFETTGTFPYHCVKHPTSAAEKGVITVNAQS